MRKREPRDSEPICHCHSSPRIPSSLFPRSVAKWRSQPQVPAGGGSSAAEVHPGTQLGCARCGCSPRGIVLCRIHFPLPPCILRTAPVGAISVESAVAVDGGGEGEQTGGCRRSEVRQSGAAASAITERRGQQGASRLAVTPLTPLSLHISFPLAVRSSCACGRTCTVS